MAKVVRHLNAESTEFVKTFNKLMTSRAAWEIWADFVTFAAIAISNSVDKENAEKREEEYLNTASKYKSEEMQIFSTLFYIVVNAFENNPEQDFLGDLYMALELGNHWKGQFFTPYCVTKVMAATAMDSLAGQVEEKGYITVNDCACGAGATLIAAANYARDTLKENNLNWQNHIMFTAQDIDAVTAKMCYIQLSLLGCAGFVKVGDTFMDPMREGDDNTKYWYTPMWFSEVWYFRRLWYSFDRVLGTTKAKPPSTEEQKPARLEIDLSGLFDKKEHYYDTGNS